MRRPRGHGGGDSTGISKEEMDYSIQPSRSSSSLSPAATSSPWHHKPQRSTKFSTLLITLCLAVIGVLLLSPYSSSLLWGESLATFNNSLLLSSSSALSYNGMSHLSTALDTTTTTTLNDSIEKFKTSSKKIYFERYSEYAPTCKKLTHVKDVAFTLVTQTSMSRLWLMKHHCELWKGPISVAVLVPPSDKNSQFSSSNNNSTIIIQTIQNQLETKYGCSQSQVTVSILNRVGFTENDYPVNHLRNIALRHVQTTHIMYVDIDFWPSSNLYDTLSNTNYIKREFINDPKLALVVPAFQFTNGLCKLGNPGPDRKTKCRQRDIQTIPTTKEQLLPMLNQTVVLQQYRKYNETDYRVTPFQEKVFRIAHNTTLYDVWYTKQRSVGSLHTLPCVQSGVYEPYLATRYCRDMPPFQEIFTGYGQNKATWILQLRSRGYIFKQIGGVFVIHFPHDDSPAKEVWKQHPSEIEQFWINPIGKENITDNKLQQYKRGQMDKALLQFRSWLINTKDVTSPHYGRKVIPKERFGRCKDWIDQDYRLWVVDDEEKGRLQTNSN